LAPDPTWSTGASNDAGNASGAVWCPRTVDTTVQIPDGDHNGMGWSLATGGRAIHSFHTVHAAWIEQYILYGESRMKYSLIYY
jgi:hypothetical protein